MGKWLIRLWAVLLAAVVLMVTGCPPKAAEEPSTDSTSNVAQPPVTPSTAEAPAPKPPVPIKVPETLQTLEAAPMSIPETKLTETERARMLVLVGDALPEGEVVTVDGEKKMVAELLGKKGTVVFFWGVGGSEIAEKMAIQALVDLEGDAYAAYGDQGLAVISITPNAPPEDAKEGGGTVENVSATIVSRLEMSKRVKELLSNVKVSYPVLLDPGGAYFAKVAKATLPRVYVLDAAGKIAWFDVGFSEITREDLKRTLQFMFSSSQSAKQ